LHADNNFIVIANTTDPHISPDLAVLDRVANQVQDRSTDQGGIPHYRPGLAVFIDELHPRRCCKRPQDVKHLLHNSGQFHSSPL